MKSSATLYGQPCGGRPYKALEKHLRCAGYFIHDLKLSAFTPPTGCPLMAMRARQQWLNDTHWLKPSQRRFSNSMKACNDP
ncbi:MAG: hypothetical protein HY231_27205 [Acidobacteria bacterium]|nr:hypothetical protein [Acidobacteriota bacterium]